MARIPPARCGRTDRGDSTAWDDSNDDVCPRLQTSSDPYPHTDHANHAAPHTYHNTAHDHDDVAAECKRVCILYCLHYREQGRGVTARPVCAGVRQAAGRTDAH